MSDFPPPDATTSSDRSARSLRIVAALGSAETEIVAPSRPAAGAETGGSGPVPIDLATRLAALAPGPLDCSVELVAGDDLDPMVQAVTASLTSDAPPHLVVLGTGWAHHPSAAGPELVDRVRVGLEGLIAASKEADSCVIVCNASTFDPDADISAYGGPEPLALRLHRIDALLVELSQETGISIVDVDRVVARIGGQDHVPRIGHLDGPGAAAVAEELARVVEDYGFLDDRPLLAQRGRRRRRS